MKANPDQYNAETLAQEIQTLKTRLDHERTKASYSHDSDAWINLMQACNHLRRAETCLRLMKH